MKTVALSVPSLQQVARLLRALLPSFLAAQDGTSQPVEIRSTAWLDGLRGWASLIVFFYHFLYSYHKWVVPGYGVEGKNHNLLQLPIIRLFAAGPAMVCLFFVVSGYSLSWAPMKELHNGNASKALSRLASSTFRRPIRIFLPPVIASFLVLVFIRLGVYTEGDIHHDGWSRFGYWAEVRPPIMSSLGEQLIHYYQNTSRLLNVFDFDQWMEYPYDGHLWTIPTEFRYSIVLFSVMTAMAIIRLAWRLILAAAVWMYCIWQGAWEPTLFIGGMLLAQIALIRGHGKQAFIGDDLPLVEINKKLEKSERRRKFAMIVLFVAGLYFASAPDSKPEETPGYVTIFRYLTPYWWNHHRVHFIYSTGAFALVISVSESPALQSFFHNAVSRYLGRISFGLYLVHGPVCHMVGYALIPRLWAYTNGPVQAPLEHPLLGAALTDEQRLNDAKRAYEGGTEMGFEVGFLLGGLVVVPLTIWAADLFTRYVDEPVVKFARRVEMGASPES